MTVRKKIFLICPKKTVALVLALVMLAALVLSGCAGKSKNYDLYIFNSKGEIAAQLEECVKDYEAQTGVRIKVQTVGSGTPHLEALRVQMNSRGEAPTIFSVQGLRECQEWEMSGRVRELSLTANGDFANFANKIPEEFRLSSNGENSFGVPYCIEGYGYIADRKMLAALFPKADIDALVKDLKSASYAEFEALLGQVKEFILKGSAKDVTLSDSNYIFAKEKNEQTKKLTGVFAVAGSERWTWCDQMMNVALGAVFPSAADLSSATAQQIDSAKGALKGYLKALDKKSSIACGDTGMLSRSPEFISSSTNDYNQTVQRFANGKALFIKQGNWITPNIAKIYPDLLRTLEIFPVKMPIMAEDFTRSDISVKDFQSSIPVYAPNFWAINSGASADEQRKAEDFLLWLCTSEQGLHYVKDVFGSIPYNAEPGLQFENSLNNSVLSYVRSEKTLPAAYHGISESWTKDVVGRFLQENYMTKPDWSQADHAAMLDHIISTWKSAAGV